MRSATLVAAFAAGALAVPHQHHHHKRAVVTETDVEVVYVTDVVTVTAGQPTPEAAPASPETHEASSQNNWQHSHHHWWTSQWSHPSPSTEQPAAAPTSPTSAYAPPPPPSPTPDPEPSSEPEAPSSTWQAPPPPPPSQPTAPSSPPTSYNDIAKLHHNIHRSNHSSPDIEWDDDLAAAAQQIGETCVYAHSMDVNGINYGQNIAAGVEPNNISNVISDLFYNGEIGYFKDYYGNPSPINTTFEKWGHFSQLVWAESTKFACATVDCSAQGLANVGSNVPPYFTVCNYFPRGNVNDTYDANVGFPKNDATATWDYGL